MNIIEKYKVYCKSKGVSFQLDDNVKSYNDSTLFCPAGMQQFKDKFKDESYFDTLANVQSVIRMNDFEEIGDSTHLLYFNMIGLFSFRKMEIQEAVNFWLEFLSIIGLKLSYVTIHPDKPDWLNLYHGTNIEVRFSNDCIWSDGEIGGYCTEFFIDDVEIGNIVNPLGDCIDVGFGLERLEMFVNNKVISKEETLKDTILKIIDSGFKPSNLKQGYVLRKLLRELWKCNYSIDHPYFQEEIARQEKILIKYNRLKDKFSHMPKEWWYDTHGINIDDLN